MLGKPMDFELELEELKKELEKNGLSKSQSSANNFDLDNLIAAITEELEEVKHISPWMVDELEATPKKIELKKIVKDWCDRLSPEYFKDRQWDFACKLVNPAIHDSIDVYAMLENGLVLVAEVVGETLTLDELEKRIGHRRYALAASGKVRKFDELVLVAGDVDGVVKSTCQKLSCNTIGVKVRAVTIQEYFESVANDHWEWGESQGIPRKKLIEVDAACANSLPLEVIRKYFR